MYWEKIRLVCYHTDAPFVFDRREGGVYTWRCAKCGDEYSKSTGDLDLFYACGYFERGVTCSVGRVWCPHRETHKRLSMPLWRRWMYRFSVWLQKVTEEK